MSILKLYIKQYLYVAGHLQILSPWLKMDGKDSAEERDRTGKRAKRGQISHGVMI